MSNRSQRLQRAIRESVTPLTVAPQVAPKAQEDEPKVILAYTVGTALSRAMAEVVSKTYNVPASAFERQKRVVQA